MNKLIIIFGIVQTTLFFVLTAEMVSVHQSISRMATSSPAPTATQQVNQVTQVDPALVRRIVDEALQEISTTSSVVQSSQPDIRPQPDQPDQQATDKSWASASEKLSYMKSAGTMSNEQLRDFESSVSGLDPARRRQMLGALFNALNSGEVKGLL